MDMIYKEVEEENDHHRRPHEGNLQQIISLGAEATARQPRLLQIGNINTALQHISQGTPPLQLHRSKIGGFWVRGIALINFSFGFEHSSF
jgi:hypothetical protein